MRKDPRSEGSRWLIQARADLRWTRHLAQEGAHYLVCFLSQQVAEKALKAFLYIQGEPRTVSCSVWELCLRAGEYDERFQEHLEAWSLLDTFYLPTRYPNYLPGSIPAHVYNRSTAEGALALAEAVVAEVETLFDE